MHRYRQPEPTADQLRMLRQRLGSVHVRQRLGIEHDHAVDLFGHGRLLHPENWLSAQSLLRALTRISGMAALGRPLARRHRVHRRDVGVPGLPLSLDGLSMLHLTDMHLDMAGDTTDALIDSLAGVEADITVMTGDYRARTYGPIDPVLRHMRRLRPHLPGDCFGILGNHDCLAMAPAFEGMGIRMLLNEALSPRDGLHLIGVDDPHYYRVDSLERAMTGLPDGGCRVLLAHSPEIFRQAAHAGIDLMLAGHTHGGQVCLPGGFAMIYDCDCPRRYCRGAWRYREMSGYTSAGCGTSLLDIRFFCPPEIVVHVLRAVDSQ